MSLKPRSTNQVSKTVSDSLIKAHLDSRAPSSAVRNYLKQKGFKISGSKNSFLAAGATEKEVENALSTLVSAPKKFIKFSTRRYSPYERNQSLRQTFREIAQLKTEKEALKYLKLGKEVYEKQVQSQAVSNEPPKQIQELEKQIKAHTGLGGPTAEHLQAKCDKLTFQWLKKKDPTGKEAQKFLHSKIPTTTEKYQTLKTLARPSLQEETPSSPSLEPPPPPIPLDPLGPDVL